VLIGKVISARTRVVADSAWHIRNFASLVGYDPVFAW